MGKKSARLHLVSAAGGGHDEDGFGNGWDPLAERQRGRPERDRPEREQRYVRHVKPKSDAQAALMEAIDANDITLALGPAGTGKTYLAVAKAVEALQSGRVKRIVLCRPAVEAGESLGFLPGSFMDKIDPYMRPLYDALFERMAPKQVQALIDQKVIEIAPLAYMRGRTIAGAAIVCDEAQNATRGQLKMVMTRLGFGSFMVLTGDPDQSDLEPGDSGLAETAAQLDGKCDRVGVVRLSDVDVVRHPTIRSLLPLLTP